MSDVDFASFHTTYPCWLLFEYACVSSSLDRRCHGCVRTCGAEISKLGVRSCWAMGVFVLVLSNINIVWQKSLSAPLTGFLQV